MRKSALGTYEEVEHKPGCAEPQKMTRSLKFQNIVRLKEKLEQRKISHCFSLHGSAADLHLNFPLMQKAGFFHEQLKYPD